VISRPTFLLCSGLLCVATLLGCPPTPPEPPPTPPPSTTTTTTTTTTLPEDSICLDNLAPTEGPAGNYVPAVWRPPTHLETLIEIRDTVGGCDPDSPYEKIANVALRLRRDYDLCAVWKEEGVLVQAADGLFEEYYPVTIPTGCFATRDRMYKGVLAWIGAAR
jgi:hypothetical protein